MVGMVGLVSVVALLGTWNGQAQDAQGELVVHRRCEVLPGHEAGAWEWARKLTFHLRYQYVGVEAHAYAEMSDHCARIHWLISYRDLDVREIVTESLLADGPYLTLLEARSRLFDVDTCEDVTLEPID